MKSNLDLVINAVEGVLVQSDGPESDLVLKTSLIGLLEGRGRELLAASHEVTQRLVAARLMTAKLDKGDEVQLRAALARSEELELNAKKLNAESERLSARHETLRSELGLAT